MKKGKLGILFLLCTVTPIVLLFFSLFIGRYDMTIGQVLEILLYPTEELRKTVEYSLIWDVRLPRALMAIMVGAALAISGGALQGVFRNPLVDAGMLGVSNGAAFGACLGILLSGSMTASYVLSFVFGILAVLVSVLIGRIYSSAQTVTLVLGGVIVSAVFSALISFVKFIADPLEKLPTITFWLMGSMSRASYKELFYASFPIFIGMLGILLVRWRINVLSLGDKEALTLGVNTKVCRMIVILCASLTTAGAVCVSGTIGWIGLIIPHIVRMMVGNDNRVLLPVCISLGGCFMLLIDLLARTISGAEIPLGVLTAIIGGPFFVLILYRTKGDGSW